MTRVLAGPGAGEGLVASIHDGLLVQDLGIAVLMATVTSFGRFQLGVTAGLVRGQSPEPRLRRLPGDADRRLAAGMKLSSDEFVIMRTTLTRIMRVGDRVADQSVSWRWVMRSGANVGCSPRLCYSRSCFRRHRLASRIALFHGDHKGLPALGIALLLLTTDLAGVFIRASRCRREQHDLGVELRSESTKLLTRLETMPGPISTAAPVARIVSTIRTIARQLLHDGQPGLLGIRQNATSTRPAPHVSATFGA